MIQPINSINFKAIYKNPDINFSIKQEKIANDIVRSIKSPDKCGMSLENYMEKANYDFFLDAEKNNTISLSLIKNTEDEKEFGINDIEYTEKIHIGTYDSDHTFKVSDIKSKILDYVKEMALSVLLFVGLLATAIALTPKCCSGTNKEPIIDTIYHTAKNLNSNVNKTKSVCVFESLI